MKIYDKIENFCLPDHNGTEVCLSNYFDRWIVLYFYPKDNTSGCTKEAIDFTHKINEFDKRNSVVIGISPDKPTSHLSFIKKYDLKHILLCDENKEIMQKFGVWTTKNMYGKQVQGVVRSTFIINPQQEIVYEWRNVKVEKKTAKGVLKHAYEVLSKLEELQKLNN